MIDTEKQCREAFEAEVLASGYAMTNRERDIAADFWRAAWRARATISVSETVDPPNSLEIPDSSMIATEIRREGK